MGPNDATDPSYDPLAVLNDKPGFTPEQEELIDKLKGEHGEVVAILTRKGMAVFRGLKKAEHARYMSTLINEATRSTAAEMVVLMTVVQPSREVFASWIEEKPAIVTTCSGPVMELSGLDTEATTKKG